MSTSRVAITTRTCPMPPSSKPDAPSASRCHPARSSLSVRASGLAAVGFGLAAVPTRARDRLRLRRRDSASPLTISKCPRVTVGAWPWTRGSGVRPASPTSRASGGSVVRRYLDDLFRCITAPGHLPGPSSCSVMSSPAALPVLSGLLTDRRQTVAAALLVDDLFVLALRDLPLDPSIRRTIDDSTLLPPGPISQRGPPPFVAVARTTYPHYRHLASGHAGPAMGHRDARGPRSRPRQAH